MVTKPLLLNETGEAMIKAMDKQNALLEVLAKESIKTLSGDWQGVQRIVRNGYAPNIFDFGDQFVDTWTDTATQKEYVCPWQVNHFGKAELLDGEIVDGMYIQWHYAVPIAFQFSHPRAFLACPDGLAAGTYYFSLESAWGKNILAGDIVCFTLTQDIPAGGRISGCYAAPDTVKSNWRVYSHSADGKTVLETVTPTFVASGTNLGIMKATTRNGLLNSAQEMAYGWNRWKTSALRQYLNSAEGVGSWWTAQDEWDIAPDQLTQKPGFLSGCTEEFLSILKPVKIVTYTNTVYDGGGADITYDKIFLPSLEEMHIAPQIAGEGEAHEYWIRASESAKPLAQYGTYPNMRTFAVENHASPQYVRLRSANRGNACNGWYVEPGGGVNHNAASYACRCAPACIIC